MFQEKAHLLRLKKGHLTRSSSAELLEDMLELRIAPQYSKKNAKKVKKFLDLNALGRCWKYIWRGGIHVLVQMYYGNRHPPFPISVS